MWDKVFCLAHTWPSSSLLWHHLWRSLIEVSLKIKSCTQHTTTEAEYVTGLLVLLGWELCPSSHLPGGVKCFLNHHKLLAKAAGCFHRFLPSLCVYRVSAAETAESVRGNRHTFRTARIVQPSEHVTFKYMEEWQRKRTQPNPPSGGNWFSYNPLRQQ